MIKSEKSLFHLVTTFTTPLSGSHYVHYAMIKRKKELFSLSHYVNYAMIKRRKKTFFHFSTTFATPWSQQEDINFYCATTLTALRS